MELIYILVVGAVAGWLAGQIMRGSGFGLLWNIIFGILGGFVGSWIFGELGVRIASGTLGTIITSAIGAMVIVFVINLLRGK